MEADVAVVAAGTAGLAATVATAEKGVRVSTFEKASTIGGTGNIATGSFANRACETRRDEIFNKSPRYLRPIKQSRFYAAKLAAGAMCTLGVIKINY